MPSPHHLHLPFPFLFLFLSSLLPLPLSSPLPPQPPPPPTPPTNLTVPFPQLTDLTAASCIRKRSLFTPCPNYYDCAQAIFQLPNLAGEGSFHNGAPDDVFSLPVRKTHGSCAVRVELLHEGTGRQSASWQGVIAMALRLAEACIKTPLRSPENMGGWMTMGKQERLVIYLESSRAGVGWDGVTVL